MTYIKEQWYKFLDARKARIVAESEISNACMAPEKNICINNIVVVGNLNSTMYSSVCKHFNLNGFCDDSNCPMYKKNAQYILQKQQYEQARSDFFRSFLPWRSK